MIKSRCRCANTPRTRQQSCREAGPSLASTESELWVWRFEPRAQPRWTRFFLSTHQGFLNAYICVMTRSVGRAVGRSRKKKARTKCGCSESSAACTRGVNRSALGDHGIEHGSI
jgi:hypothetical protein